jgi:tetratricopeptide (TPR) repeat protein
LARYDTGLSTIEKALSINPRLIVDAIYYFNKILSEVSDNIIKISFYNRIIDILVKYKTIQPENSIKINEALSAFNANLGNYYLEIGEHSKAIEKLKEALSTAAEGAQNFDQILKMTAAAYVNMGNTTLFNNDYKLPESFFLRAIKLNPGSSSPFIGLSKLLTHTRDHERAVKICFFGVKRDPSCENYTFLGIAYVAKGDYNKALEIFKKALSIGPDNPYAYFNIGNVYLILRDKTKALKYLNKACDYGHSDACRMFTQLQQK